MGTGGLATHPRPAAVHRILIGFHKQFYLNNRINIGGVKAEPRIPIHILELPARVGRC